MILRKPYAFLIRKFRLIHFLLFLLLSYICYKTNEIYSYFSDCIKSGSIVGETHSVGFLIFVLILLAIGIFSLILVLMNRKKKPTKYYLFSIITYSVLIIILLFVNSQMFNILVGDTDIRVLTIVKDLLLIMYLAQYLFTIMALVRATGFNIKKFDFQADLKELSILSEDNEEFELDVELDINDVKTKLKRNLRIAKYILRENKFLVTVVLSGIGIYLIVTGVLDIFIYNRVYKEKHVFKVNTMSVEVLNSYETKLDYKRDKIDKSNKKFNVVEVRIKNNGSENKVLNTKNIKLKTGEYNYYTIEPKYNSNFIDLGTGYKKQSIKPGETKTYLFVFLIPDEETEETVFQMLINVTKENNEYTYNYAKVKLDLKKTEKPNTIETKNLKEEINLKDSILKNTTIKIDEVSYNNYETYEYKKTINEKEYKFIKVVKPNINDYYEKSVAKLKATVKFDESITNTKVNNKLFENFGEIRYIKNGKTYTYSNITETIDLNGEYYYIDIPKFAIDSDNIYLDIVLRDKKYTYILK